MERKPTGLSLDKQIAWAESQTLNIPVSTTTSEDVPVRVRDKSQTAPKSEH